MNFLDHEAFVVSYNLLRLLPKEPRYLKVSDAPLIFGDSPVCSFTGHRPEKMGITEETSGECLALKLKLREVVADLLKRGYKTFITGMARGVDTWAAEAVLEASYKDKLKLKLYAAVPYPGQCEKWYYWEQDRYEEILRQCNGVFVMCKSYTHHCMAWRNSFLVKYGDPLVAVFNGEPGGTANTIEMARKKNREIITVDPRFLTKSSERGKI